MAGTVEAVRKALYPCFPDQGPNEINSLVETDKSISYAMAAFGAGEMPERAMLMALHYSASVPVHGFLWITNRRLLFVAAIRGLKPHPFYREIAFADIERILFDRSRWFQVAKLTLNVTGLPEPIVFESIIKNELLQQFVDHLQNKVANPQAAGQVDENIESPEQDEDFVAKLERLSRLNALGMLADAEFEAAKKKLLGL